MGKMAEDFCGVEAIPKREWIKNRQMEMHEKYANAGPGAIGDILILKIKK